MSFTNYSQQTNCIHGLFLTFVEFISAVSVTFSVRVTSKVFKSAWILFDEFLTCLVKMRVCCVAMAAAFICKVCPAHCTFLINILYLVTFFNKLCVLMNICVLMKVGTIVDEHQCKIKLQNLHQRGNKLQ